MRGSESPVAQQYEALRRKLLDTSLRNRMISYRPARASGVEILPKEPASLFRLLCSDGKTFSFTGVPDPPSRQGRSQEPGPFEDTPEKLEEYEMKAREELGDFLQNPLELDLLKDPAPLADTRLSTPHTVSNLHRRLTKIWRDSKALMEESGLNVLFLALGSVTWREVGINEDRIAPLLFIPCHLDRQSNGQFRLRHDGGDLGSNLAFAVQAKEQFGLEMPEWNEDESAAAFFALIEERTSRMPGWKVDPTFCALGFFQFTKLVMYEDLDLARWPTEDSPLEDKDIKALFGEGYGPISRQIPTDAFIDDWRPIESCHEVYDCDSSQALAILQAQTGESMVIEGPPGTGKSQTIANLIAEFVASGKKVLFVSEKLAALEVVHRRLDQAGLADACLELHSRGSRRKSFYDELRRTMSLSRSYQGPGQTLERLSTLRKELNDYCLAINDPLEPFGLSPHQAIGELLQLPKEEQNHLELRPDFSHLSHLTWESLQSCLPLLDGCQEKLKEVGPPSVHPFFGSSAALVTQSDLLEIQKLVDDSVSSLSLVADQGASLARRLGLNDPERLSEMAVLAKCARYAVEAPARQGLSLARIDWELHQSTIKQALASLSHLQEIKLRCCAQVVQEAWTQDLSSTAAAYREWSGKWHKFLIPEWNSHSRLFRGLLSAQGPQDPQGQKELIEHLILAQRESAVLKEAGGFMASLFGEAWQGESSDPASLKRLLDWALFVRAEASQGHIPPAFLASLEKEVNHQGLLEEALNLLKAVKLFDSTIDQLCRKISFSESELRSTSLSALAQKLDAWKSGLHLLPGLAQFNVIKQNLVKEGLASIIPVLDTWPDSTAPVGPAILRSWLEGMIRQAVRQRPALAGFDRHTHHQKTAEFRTLDSVVLAHNRARVIASHLKGIPNWELALGNLALLRRQTELKRGHKPIRWAMEKAGEAVQRMKPVFLMSPLSVAQFLPAGSVNFDVVIFDEASQIKPEDALCSIIRAKQTIVVGDSKQMPPTSFFNRLVYSEDEEAPDEVQSLSGLESILALMGSVVHGTARTADLKWHYRSLHPSLIEPSNVAFYDRRLVIFPSAESGNKLGLKWRHDPSHVYDRGASRTNRKEAQSVAEAVLDHIRSSPGESLGVAAFSKTQQEAIQDALDLLSRQSPGALDAFDALHPFEPLFVKNLETVQGDERDVIFVSVGYGKDESGRLTMNFGPVNAEGGERRLNVLMSRARRRCEVFSSITAGDITLSETSGEGLATLRMFLSFAETGQLEDAKGKQAMKSSPLAGCLAKTLLGHGLAVEERVGSSAFYLDLAVRRPSEESASLLGVELDGEGFALARSARDREKLRHEALERRGWNLHRSWSMDLWQSLEDEAARIAKEAASRDASDPPQVEDKFEEEEPEADFEDLLTEPPPVITGLDALPEYRAWSGSLQIPSGGLAALPPPQMAAMIWEVVSAEGPVHQELVLLRLKEAAGVIRSGSRIQTAFGLGLEHALIRGPILARGAFLMLPEQAATGPRSRAFRSAAERKGEWVPPQELEEALFKAVVSSFGIEADQAVSQAWKLLGFQRRSPSMVQLARLGLNKLVRTGRIVSKGTLLEAAEEPPKLRGQ